MTPPNRDPLIELLPGWEAMRRDYIESGVPGLFVIRPTPGVTLFVDAGAVGIGGRFEVTGHEAVPASPMDALTIAEVSIDGVRYIQVATRTTELFRNLYLLLADVVFDVVGRDVDVRSALAASLSRWSALLRATAILTEERQAGLFGELWVLRRLVAVGGPSAVDTWTGFARQSHDFRLPGIELEVKTTSSARRIHTVNGIAQLDPSPDCVLHIVSLRLVDGGTGGQTLGEAVAGIRSLLGEDTAALGRFNNGLSMTGYRDVDEPHYPRRRKLADAAILVPVEDGCPRLTREALDAVPPAFATEFVVGITYDIDLTGRGFADGTPEFHAVLPPPTGTSPGGST